MNGTEARYADEVLLPLLRAGEILDYRFEAVKFRLADNTTYTADFMVTTKAGLLVFHEVKGSWKAPHQDDAKVKIKVAAEMYWQFEFLSAESIPRKKGGGWKIVRY
jgi:hypothetical protein